jgi:hypothetical protein
MLRTVLIVIVALWCVTAAAGAIPTRTVIFEGAATVVGVSPIKSNDLWVTLKDLKRATGFVVKPQGICRDELCFPIPRGGRAEFIARKDGLTWFNLSAFARLVKQPTTADVKNDVWYFGPRADAQNALLTSLEAPDFTLPDLVGKMHSLSDFRGKKVLLITWASW